MKSTIVSSLLAILLLKICNFPVVEARKLRGEKQGRDRKLQAPALTIVVPNGNNNNQSPLLGRCEGECDSDADCQPGLICFQRTIDEPVPFCSGIDDTSRGDYCTVTFTDAPTWVPTESPSSMPSLTPTTPPTSNPTSSPTFLPTSSPTLAPCPDDLSTFTAVTAIVFDAPRPNPLLSDAERAVLNEEFVKVYNTVSFDNCDSSFRRLNGVTFVEQAVVPTRQRRSLIMNQHRKLQTTSANDTQVPLAQGESTRLVYEVSGQCRDCPVDDEGSFRLYDNAFARRLQAALRRRSRKLQAVQPITNTAEYVASINYTYVSQNGALVGGTSVTPGSSGGAPEEDTSGIPSILGAQEDIFSDPNFDGTCRCADPLSGSAPPNADDCVLVLNAQIEALAQQEEDLFQDVAATDIFQVEEEELVYEKPKKNNKDKNNEDTAVSRQYDDYDNGFV